MAWFGRPMGPPPPAVFGNIQYRYHTRDGGVPNDGKVPSATGPPPPQYHPMFGGPPPPYSAGPPCPQWAVPPPSGFMPPPPAGRPGPCRLWAPPSGPPPAAPPGPPYSAPYWQPPPPSAPPAAPCAGPPWYAGPPAAPPSSGVDPGNRSLGRTAKFEDGTGVLLGEEQTTFHVLEPGEFFQDSAPWAPVKDQNFRTQSADSDWTVSRLMKALGAGTEARTGRDPNHWSRMGQPKPEAAIEEWHEQPGGIFRRGSAIRESDPRANLCLKQHGWGPDRGKAGSGPPVWVMLYPIKGSV